MNRKIIAFLLVLTALIGSLAGCAKANDGKKNDPTVDTSEFADHLPDHDFDGEQVVIATYFDEIRDSITADDINGDAVQVKTYENEKTVEERFGVEVEVLSLASTPTSLEAMIGTKLLAGTSDYDILGAWEYYDTDLAIKDCLLDLNDLSGYGADGLIDLTAPYWADDYVKAMNPGSKLYWLIGDISYMTVGTLYCTFVNLDLYNKYMLEKHGSIYDLVRNYEFTIDLVMQMSAEIYQDVDDKTGMSEGDIVGFASYWGSVVEGLMLGAGVKVTRTYSDGTLEFALDTPENVAMMSKVGELKEDPNSLTVRYAQALYAEDDLMRCFSPGNALFVPSRLSYTSRLREMQSDYGVVPLPHYSANQKEYYTTSHDTIPIFGINASSEHVLASVYVLEAMSAYANKNVLPVYFDEALKYKYTRDEDSAEMIDLIHDSIMTDFCYAWSEQMMEITHTFRDLTSKTVASTMKKKGSAWKLTFDELIAKLK